MVVKSYYFPSVTLTHRVVPITVSDQLLVESSEGTSNLFSVTILRFDFCCSLHYLPTHDHALTMLPVKATFSIFTWVWEAITWPTVFPCPVDNAVGNGNCKIEQ